MGWYAKGKRAGCSYCEVNGERLGYVVPLQVEGKQMWEASLNVEDDDTVSVGVYDTEKEAKAAVVGACHAMVRIEERDRQKALAVLDQLREGEGR